MSKILARLLRRASELVVPFLREGAAATRQIAVENLARAETPVQPFIAELAECAVDSSKLLRDATEPLLRQEPEAARPLLEKAAADPKAAKRDQAVRLLARIYGAAARKFLEDIRASEKNAGVKEAIAGACANSIAPQTAPQAVSELPPHEPIALHPPVTPALRECLEKLFAEYNAFAANITSNQGWPRHRREATRLSESSLDFSGPDDLDRTCRLLEEGGAGTMFPPVAGERVRPAQHQGRLTGRCWNIPTSNLIHLVRFLAMIEAIEAPEPQPGCIDWHSNQSHRV